MVERLVNVTRVRRKGVVVIPKAVRELAGIRECEFVVKCTVPLI